MNQHTNKPKIDAPLSRQILVSQLSVINVCTVIGNKGRIQPLAFAEMRFGHMWDIFSALNTEEI